MPRQKKKKKVAKTQTKKEIYANVMLTAASGANGGCQTMTKITFTHVE